MNYKKIFGIGLGRTGTSSLTRAMANLGYKCKHGCDIDNIWKYDFISDIPISCRWKFLDYAFPKAKFILTYRDEESWIKSCRNYQIEANKKGYHIDGKYLDIKLSKAELRFNLFGVTYFKEDVFRKVYKEFHKEVFKYFKNKPNKLLVLNICKGEGWKKLCDFLGKTIPKEPFPHHNQAKYETRI